MAIALVLMVGLLSNGGMAEAITAPELRGQRAVQDISQDMHGRDLKERSSSRLICVRWISFR